MRHTPNVLTAHQLRGSGLKRCLGPEIYLTTQPPSPHKAPKGGKRMGSQITTLLFAVWMSELPVKSSLTIWAGARVITE